MGNETLVGKFKSKSQRGVEYRVMANKKTGALTCDCPAFTKWNNGKCRHIESVRFKQMNDGTRKEEE